MDIDRGYFFFRKYNGKVLCFRTKYNGLVTTIGKGFLIMIDERDSLERQVKTLICGLLHIDYEFERMQNSKEVDRNEKVLKERLREEAESVYDKHPEFVKYLQRKYFR